MAAESKIEFELVSPEALVVSEAVEMVTVPGSEGDMGILPRHAPLISALRTGVIAVRNNGETTHRFFVAGGFVEVTPERCTVLAESTQKVEEIDTAVVEKALADARDDLRDAKDEREKTRIEKQIAVLEAQLQAVAH